MATPNPNDDSQNPPMQLDPALFPLSAPQGEEITPMRPATGSASGTSRAYQPPPPDVGQRMTPTMTSERGMTPAEPSPQGPPPTGKEQFHNTMADLAHRAEANRAAVIGLDPSDPDYTKKLSALQAQHGALTTEKARYQMLHPWGGPESAHPGVLG